MSMWTRQVRHLAGIRCGVPGYCKPMPPMALHSATRLYVRQRAPLPSDADKYDPLVNILEDESLPIRINKVSSSGVQLADGQEYPPTCIFLDGRAFVWNVPPIDKMQAMPNGHGWEAWTNDIWSLFELTTPRPGTGDVVLPVPARIKTYLNSLGIQLDVQSTRNACSTFNLLSEEGRKVALALLPQSK